MVQNSLLKALDRFELKLSFIQRVLQCGKRNSEVSFREKFLTSLMKRAKLFGIFSQITIISQIPYTNCYHCRSLKEVFDDH